MQSPQHISTLRVLWLVVAAATTWFTPSAHAANVSGLGCESFDEDASYFINGCDPAASTALTTITDDCQSNHGAGGDPVDAICKSGYLAFGADSQSKWYVKVSHT